MQQEKSWVKTVRDRSMLIPTLDAVKASIGKLNPQDEVDVTSLREALASQFGTDSTCPVTVRRHLKTLGVLAKPTTRAARR